MFRAPFQNGPAEYKDHFEDELRSHNIAMASILLRVLLPVSLFMLALSIWVHDTISVIVAMALLAAGIGTLVIFKENSTHHASLTYLTHALVLFWGIHLMGYNTHNLIFVMDFAIAIFISTFLFMTKFQVQMLYYTGGLIYLFAFTPYLKATDFDKVWLVSPILLLVSAFFLSRMLFNQYIERFVMSEQLKDQKQVLTSELSQTTNELQQTQKSVNQDIIKTLVKVLEYHDFYTRGHSENVAELAYAIGKNMDLNKDQLDELLLCGLVHDIGKILIPTELLNKTEPLTQEEFGVIRKHSEYGYNLLMEAHYLNRIAEIVLHHHERWDGKGYPLRLKGDQIPLESQILMVADSWDAMTSERIYKSAKPFAVAKKELIALSGHQFSPEVVEAFLLTIRSD